jgi:cytochrome b561
VIDAGSAWISLLVLLAIGAFHGLFQFWRHNALYDGALKLITPKFMHKVL